MAGLLRRLLAPYDNDGNRIAFADDDLPFGPSAITPIALIFHELATNAVKYGALSDCAGSLHIELGRVEDRFTIGWLEASLSPAPPLRCLPAATLTCRAASARDSAQPAWRLLRAACHYKPAD